MTSAWDAVDAYVGQTIATEDEVLRAARERATAAGLPQIEVTAAQGRLLELLVALKGAARVLEVGTLAAYSTIWMGRGLPQGGRIDTIEHEPRHAEIARANLDAAGLADRVTVHTGDALEVLTTLDGPYLP